MWNMNIKPGSNRQNHNIKQLKNYEELVILKIKKKQEAVSNQKNER